MERLTLEEAIKYEKEVAERNYRDTEYESIDSIDDDIKTIYRERAKEHEQLANWLEELKSYKEAEEQGLIVRLLCKAGTEVFAVSSGSSHYVVKCRIKKIESSLTEPEKISYFLEPIEYRRCSFRYFSNEFGKTVFLTREEAEKKLEEMKKNDERKNGNLLYDGRH